MLVRLIALRAKTLGVRQQQMRAHLTIVLRTQIPGPRQYKMQVRLIAPPVRKRRARRHRLQARERLIKSLKSRPNRRSLAILGKIVGSPPRVISREWLSSTHACTASWGREMTPSLRWLSQTAQTVLMMPLPGTTRYLLPRG